MDELIPILISYFHEDTTLYWASKVTPIEYNILNVEIQTYNIWIETFLMSGKGPKCSYVSTDDADLLVFVNDPGYQEVFGRPGQRWPYEHTAILFELINLLDPDSEEGEIYKKKGIKGINTESGNELVHILTTPFSSEEWGMGYRVLPMTQLLIDKKRL